MTVASQSSSAHDGTGDALDRELPSEKLVDSAEHADREASPPAASETSGSSSPRHLFGSSESEDDGEGDHPVSGIAGSESSQTQPSRGATPQERTTSQPRANSSAPSAASSASGRVILQLPGCDPSLPRPQSELPAQSTSFGDPSAAQRTGEVRSPTRNVRKRAPRTRTGQSRVTRSDSRLVVPDPSAILRQRVERGTFPSSPSSSSVPPPSKGSATTSQKDGGRRRPATRGSNSSRRQAPTKDKPVWTGPTQPASPLPPARFTNDPGQSIQEQIALQARLHRSGGLGALGRQARNLTERARQQRSTAETRRRQSERIAAARSQVQREGESRHAEVDVNLADSRRASPGEGVGVSDAHTSPALDGDAGAGISTTAAQSPVGTSPAVVVQEEMHAVAQQGEEAPTRQSPPISAPRVRSVGKHPRAPCPSAHATASEELDDPEQRKRRKTHRVQEPSHERTTSTGGEGDATNVVSDQARVQTPPSPFQVNVASAAAPQQAVSRLTIESSTPPAAGAEQTPAPEIPRDATMADESAEEIDLPSPLPSRRDDGLPMTLSRRASNFRVQQAAQKLRDLRREERHIPNPKAAPATFERSSTSRAVPHAAPHTSTSAVDRSISSAGADTVDVPTRSLSISRAVAETPDLRNPSVAPHATGNSNAGSARRRLVPIGDATLRAELLQREQTLARLEQKTIASLLRLSVDEHVLTTATEALDARIVQLRDRLREASRRRREKAGSSRNGPAPPGRELGVAHEASDTADRVHVEAQQGAGPARAPQAHVAAPQPHAVAAERRSTTLTEHGAPHLMDPRRMSTTVARLMACCEEEMRSPLSERLY